MEWINFRHLYSFWMVKRLGGFQKASQEMRVSQSTVSEQVSQLEDYLQEKLFERSTRKLGLTETGVRLFKYADDIFHKSREINRVIRDGEGGREPITLKSGIAGGVSRNLLYRMYHEFLVSREEVKLEVVNGEFEDLLKLCANFELDFVVSTQLPHGASMMNFNSKLIQKSPLCLAGKKKVIKKLTSPKKSDRPIDVYLFSYPHGSSDLTQTLNKYFDQPFQVKLESDDISLLRFFANSQDGIAILPEIGVYEDFQSGQIEVLDVPFAEDVHFYAIYHEKCIHLEEVDDLLGQRIDIS